MNIIEKHIDEIRPYWRNPRKNDKAVEAVKESIQQYGYNSPIVVDTKGVIIAGHTRYKAMRQLGYERFNVIVLDLPDDKAKQYRIADNKAAEKAEWDDDLLTFELREIEELGDMTAFFNTGELDKFFDMANEDFTPASFESTESIMRAEVIQAMPAAVGTPSESKRDDYDREVSARVELKMQEEARRQAEVENERMKIRMREMEEENKRIKEREAEMKEEFTVRSNDRLDDLISVKCPHCEESYMLSKSDLMRRDKIANE